jgi:5-methylcytosine-specific restriction endonuclease McrA
VDKRTWFRIIKLWEHRCAYCNRKTKLTKDHIQPVCRGGLDLPSNIVPCCKKCNNQKGSKYLQVWLKEKFKNDWSYIFKDISEYAKYAQKHLD